MLKGLARPGRRVARAAAACPQLDLASREPARDPARGQRTVRQRSGHRDGHRRGHAEALALALLGRLRVILLVDAEAVDNRAAELHVAAGADAVRVHHVSALIGGDRLVERAGVLGLRIAHQARV
jgi:hypothetical protein